MMFEIDFKRLAVLLLPMTLRRPLIFGLLRAGLVGLEAVYNEFKNMRAGHIFRLTHNGQVCYLRGALNETFGPGFSISDKKPEGHWLYAVKESGEGIPTAVKEKGAGVPVLYSEQELNAAQNDFRVYVPASQWSKLEQIKAVVDSYKLVTKRAHYIKTSDPMVVSGWKRNDWIAKINPIYLLKR
ncbi:MAG: hypothetical protein NC548_34370 [Lachnospiraceae bacterium]|nr:hypothetical protein [Lachnospiraceae bacterium]